MTRSFLLWAGILLAAAGAVRALFLSVRPMHTDEAVHAVKFAALLERGVYEYNPLEYHGPTLHYITFIFARLTGKTTLPELTESFLRMVPAFLGTLMVLLPLLFWDGLGRRAALFASVLLAFSPAFVFYSGYFIHEIPLVFFLGCFLGCLWRYLQKPHWFWAFLIGLSGGLMFCTKETCILSFGSAFISILLLRVFSAKDRAKQSGEPKRIQPIHILCAAAAFLIPWLLLFSAMGTHPQGVIDSLRSFILYPGHAASKHTHVQPWGYYLDLLTWMEFIEPISWNEDGIVGLALLGFFAIFWRKQRSSTGLWLSRFLALFTLFLTILYSAIPYKTPWNVLSFLYGMALLAGIAADRFLKMTVGRIEKTCVVTVLLVFGLFSPLVQSILLKNQFSAASSNPYVYGQTGPDMYQMAARVEQVAAAHPEGKNLYIQVIAAQDDYWPWPWYLRAFDRVGYFNRVDPGLPMAPLILANAEMESEIVKQLYEIAPPGRREMYLPLFQTPVYLRAGVEWKGYIRKDLWDLLQEHLPVPRQTEILPERNIQPIQEKNMQESIRFSHEAMATVFEIFIQHDNAGYASQAARAAFSEADRLETLLSRYISNSDISRITALKKGESVIVSPETIECLQIARRIYEQTNGAFDITVGGLVQLWKQQTPSEEQIRKELCAVGQNRVIIDSQKLTVTVEADEIELDLGGIGKGYAVGKMGQVLKEWKIDKALIHSGSSSVLAMDAPTGKVGWKVRLSSPIEPKKEIRMLEMRSQALSCSGLRRGSDMIHPDTGMSIQDKAAVWVRGDDPSICDGLSTAFMVMDIKDIEIFSQNHPEFAILVFLKEQPIPAPLAFGNW